MKSPSPEERDLACRTCKPCTEASASLNDQEIHERLQSLTGWVYAEGELTRTFTFRNFHHTMAFVNAAAWVAHREDHHPELRVGYKTCEVRYRTHSIDGISENDFICAAKVNALLSDLTPQSPEGAA